MLKCNYVNVVSLRMSSCTVVILFIMTCDDKIPTLFLYLQFSLPGSGWLGVTRVRGPLAEVFLWAWHLLTQHATSVNLLFCSYPPPANLTPSPFELTLIPHWVRIITKWLQLLQFEVRE